MFQDSLKLQGKYMPEGLGCSLVPLNFLVFLFIATQDRVNVEYRI